MNSHRLKKFEIKPGDSGKAVAVLKDLLYSHSDIPRAVPSTQRTYQHPTISDKYDETLVAAVSHFQKTEGLPVTGIPDLEMWAEIGYVVSKHKVNHHTLHDPELRAALMGAALKPAWPSQLGWYTHQESVKRVLATSLSAIDLQRLTAAVQDADRAEWQTVEHSPRHAMTPKGMRKEEARRLANEFVRREINTARELYDRGDHAGGMLHLGYGMHCLQDATSPAHANFREFKGGTLEYGTHINEELWDPKADSWLDEATRRAYKYFKGQLAMPNDFFADLKHDVYIPIRQRTKRKRMRR